MLNTPLPPFPSELLSESPAVATMTALELGALYALAVAYWKTKTADFGETDSVLSVLARCHTRRWYDIRDKVLPAWRVVKPQLASVYAERSAIMAVRCRNMELALASKGKRKNITKVEPMADAVGSVGAPLGQRPAAPVTVSPSPTPARTTRGAKGATLTDTTRNVA